VTLQRAFDNPTHRDCNNAPDCNIQPTDMAHMRSTGFRTGSAGCIRCCSSSQIPAPNTRQLPSRIEKSRIRSHVTISTSKGPEIRVALDVISAIKKLHRGIEEDLTLRKT
jgi:hypothetical protein